MNPVRPAPDLTLKFRYFLTVFRISDVLNGDPDPRIRTTGLRIRILLFSSGAFKVPTKKVCLLITVLTVGTFTSFFQNNKLLRLRSHKNPVFSKLIGGSVSGARPGSVQIITDPNLGRPKRIRNVHPEHCFLNIRIETIIVTL
jgi:hypothetical protein